MWDAFTIKHQNIWTHVSNINMINNMSKHTHEITILVLLSTHCTINPQIGSNSQSFIPHLSKFDPTCYKKIDNC